MSYLSLNLTYYKFGSKGTNGYTSKSMFLIRFHPWIDNRPQSSRWAEPMYASISRRSWCSLSSVIHLLRLRSLPPIQRRPPRAHRREQGRRPRRAAPLQPAHLPPPFLLHLPGAGPSSAVVFTFPRAGHTGPDADSGELLSSSRPRRPEKGEGGRRVL